MEKKGIPTVTFATEKFVALGAAQARVLGMGDLPYVALPHPLADRPPEEIRKLALERYHAVLNALTRPVRP